jgi:ferredoxin
MVVDELQPDDVVSNKCQKYDELVLGFCQSCFSLCPFDFLSIPTLKKLEEEVQTSLHRETERAAREQI